MNYPDWITEAENLYKQKYSFTKIGQILNVDRKNVSYYLQAKGYEPNHKFMPKNKVIQKTQKALNQDAFEVIDNEEKAYWLGVLMADGCVTEKRNCIELSLKEEDLYHICKYKNFLRSDHIISKKTKYIKKYDKTYISYRLSVRSNKMKDDLIKLGCVPNKTKILTFPVLEKNLIRHFIRGYIDGDGCIRKGHTSYITLEILGTENFLKGIANYFGINGHIYGFKHSSIKRFVISGIYADKILNHLYKDSTIYLIRKHDRYLEYCRLEPKLQKTQDN